MAVKESKETLKSLCREYIWYCLIELNIGGGYYANTKRFDIHDKIAELLGVDHRDERLAPVLAMLEDIGFPLECPDNESWNRIRREIGGKLYQKLVEIFDIPNEEKSKDTVHKLITPNANT